MTNLIEIRGVKHAHTTAHGPLPVLDGLDLSVPQGEFCAVVGPSGCGKSTLTRLVAGLMRPDEGEVILQGEPVKSPRKTAGMAFQNPVMLEWRTILQNVILPLEIVAPSMPAPNTHLTSIYRTIGRLIAFIPPRLRRCWRHCAIRSRSPKAERISHDTKSVDPPWRNRNFPWPVGGIGLGQ